MLLRRAGFLLVAAAMAVSTAPTDASAISCCVDGEEGCYDTNITEASCPNDSICGCKVSGSNCTLTLSANVSIDTASTCLTLGSGVTFDMNGKTLACTGNDCGKAVYNTESGGSSNKVVIKNGTITGCWDAALYFDASTGLNTNSSVSDMKIDLGSGCAGTNGINYGNGDYFNIGVSAPHGVITRTTVKNAEVGIHGHVDGDLEDSILNNNINGFMGTVGAIDNVLFLNNVTHVWEWKGTMDPDISGSSFVGGTCDCAYTAPGASNSQSCQAGIDGYCGTLQAPPSHVCSGANCTVQQ
jgi:hypothetical protein